MRIQYNYSFLGKWMQVNRKISIDTILQAIGTTSNNSLRLWEKGKSPMPVTSIMRFCNTFQVPISAFFCDMDADNENPAPCIKPDTNDQFEPDGGYVKERQQGSRGLYDPLDVQTIPSTVPGLVAPAQQEETPEPERANNTHISTTTTTDMEALIELETKHSLQRDNLLDIIAEQQKQIAELTHQLLSMKKSTRYNTPQDYTIDMAAEPKPGK